MMERIGGTLVLIGAAVCVAVLVMIIFLSRYAAHSLWLALPVAAIHGHHGKRSGRGRMGKSRE